LDILSNCIHFILFISSGLTYHDAIAETGVYEKAMNRLPAEYRLARDRRFKRAFDLNQKHENLAVPENPWREYHQVQKVFADTQRDVDEYKHMTGQWWMPYHLGRETWHGYDTKSAWFWNSKAK
jgi:Ubiquinol-cytochrome C reductase complex 14kD subunit